MRGEPTKDPAGPRKDDVVLLSRVAESVYWTGRYLERAEDIARLLKVHTELHLDLPKAVGPGWSPLLAVTGAAGAFHALHARPTEEEVIGFLAIDADNPGSVLSSLARARANLRTTRSVFASESWHALNGFFQWALDTRDEAVDRRGRLRWMDGVVQRCHLLTGLMDGVMSHDHAYAFLAVGRNLERADMTTRVLDVQADILLRSSDQLGPYADITWMSVLRSVTAGQMYRRTMGGGISGAQALAFLLKDAQFPRSVEHCLTVIARSLLELPHSALPMAGCAELQSRLESADVGALAFGGLKHWIDDLQTSIAALSETLSDSYFRVGSESLLRTA